MHIDFSPSCQSSSLDSPFQTLAGLRSPISQFLDSQLLSLTSSYEIALCGSSAPADHIGANLEPLLVSWHAHNPYVSPFLRPRDLMGSGGGGSKRIRPNFPAFLTGNCVFHCLFLVAHFTLTLCPGRVDVHDFLPGKVIGRI